MALTGEGLSALGQTLGNIPRNALSALEVMQILEQRKAAREQRKRYGEGDQYIAQQMTSGFRPYEMGEGGTMSLLDMSPEQAGMATSRGVGPEQALSNLFASGKEVSPERYEQLTGLAKLGQKERGLEMSMQNKIDIQGMKDAASAERQQKQLKGQMDQLEKKLEGAETVANIRAAAARFKAQLARGGAGSRDALRGLLARYRSAESTAKDLENLARNYQALGKNDMAFEYRQKAKNYRDLQSLIDADLRSYNVKVGVEDPADFEIPGARVDARYNESGSGAAPAGRAIISKEEEADALLE